MFTPPEGSAQPVSSPIHVGVGVPTGCGVGNGGQLAVAVVNNGIDVSFDGAAFGCTVSSGMLRFDVLLDVPIVSEESAAFIYLVLEEVSTSLVNTPWVQSAEGVASVRFDTDFPPRSCDG